jgi:hypothetical protein
MFSFHILAFFVLPVATLANFHFRLAENIVGYNFFEKFNWETLDDPTHGRVNFVDKFTAIERNYSFGASRPAI